ncbi:ATP-dependent Lon protease [Peptostreptococcaceae bacterium pGA-8]|nr:ATP-dependent Lon protease [Peptostreptococcaceae bacterium pGA-8]
MPDRETMPTFPCIALRGVTVFPGTVMSFDIGREKSLKALEKAMEADKLIYVATQRNDDIQIPTFADMYEVGTLVRVKQVLKIQGDVTRVLVEGICRASVDEIVAEDIFLQGTIVELVQKIDKSQMTLEEKAEFRVVRDAFFEYVGNKHMIDQDAPRKVYNTKDPVLALDIMANELDVNTHIRQELLEEPSFIERMRKVLRIFVEENEISKIENSITEDVKESIDNNQKEYFLKEKLKVIQKELGMGNDGNEHIQWMERLEALNLDEKIKAKVETEINKFAKMGPSSPESSVIRNYVETILDLPWNTEKETNSDLVKAEKILNKEHYGLEKVKERILEYLAVIHLSKEIKGPIVCLVGPPGVGKTSIAKSIAHATGRDFVRMSLGGVRDEAEIRGHRRTYIGAIPGRVITSIKDAGSNNPVFLFDEVDKIGADFKGDPASALLEVLDPEQNNTFTDHFLEIPFDLSKTMFITTANSLDTIPRPLLDRMEVIEVSGYTEEEKVKIAQKYLLPKKLEEHGLTKGNMKVTEKALRDLTNYYTRESGVRNLERKIADLCRKVARKIVSTGDGEYTVRPKNLEEYLGKKAFRYDEAESKNQIGVATGMAWTSVGGDTLFIEVAVVPGSGKIELTGNLGDVMKESAKAAFSYIRAGAKNLNIEEDFYNKYDIHIHVPEGAVPKDGPSAGVTMCTAITSALTGIPVNGKVSMTGEITLRGKILPVGGIKEKVLAAHRAGIKKILLPKDNGRDIEDIPEVVRKDLTFILIEEAGQALKEALVYDEALIKQ